AELLDRAAHIIRELPTSGVPANPSERSWPALEKLSRYLATGQPRVGDLPPTPPTIRGSIGAWLVKVIQRALFWYSAQIQSFQELVTSAADEQLRITQQLLSA